MLRVFGMYDCTPGSLIVNGEPLIAPCPFCFDVDLSIYRVLPGAAKASSDLHGFSIQLEIMHIIREPETISFCSFNGTSSFPFLGAPFDSDVSTSPAGAERNAPATALSNVSPTPIASRPQQMAFANRTSSALPPERTTIAGSSRSLTALEHEEVDATTSTGFLEGRASAPQIAEQGDTFPSRPLSSTTASSRKRRVGMKSAPCV